MNNKTDVYEAVQAGLYNSKLKWEDDKKAYHLDCARLMKVFKQDLFEQYGVTNHPKAELCYGKAYEYGHSSGMSEIAIAFADLVELIQDPS